MDSSKLIFKYFNNLNDHQKKIILELKYIYNYWNQKVNLISRKDINNFYTRHILHSLSVKKLSIINESNTKIMDLGTGGGFPGIPLAIVYPKNTFYLIDSKTKKIKILNEIIKEIKLPNVIAINERIENEFQKVNFIVCRGVGDLKKICKWGEKNIIKKNNNGFICFKGGNIDKELELLRKKHSIYRLKNYFSETFFETKKIICIPIKNRK